MPSILFVKTSSLGDVVHNCPAVSDVARKLPGAEIDWVVEESFAGLAALHASVRRVIPLAVRRWRSRLWQPAVWAEIGALRRALAARRYDAVIDTQSLLKSALLAVCARGERHGLDRASAREPLAAGADDGLDELAVGVLVGPLGQLGQILPPVRRFIIRAAQIEWTDRVVSRLNDVHRIEVQARGLERVAQRRRFRRALNIAEPAPEVEARRAKAMGRVGRSNGAHDDRLTRTGGGDFLEHTLNRTWPVAGSMRLAAPEAVWRERDEMWIAHERRRQSR